MKTFTVIWQGDTSEIFITDVQFYSAPTDSFEWVEAAARAQGWDEESIAALAEDYAFAGAFCGPVEWVA